ncbi:hypothetical protein ACFQPF_17815 [Fictibacillus iocasae]|uniref:Uncharacterized protein n=1 Tax=Fictibacillus iocasae TaxID=2715437 RepID=A0ABW2NT15_9BACL
MKAIDSRAHFHRTARRSVALARKLKMIYAAPYVKSWFNSLSAKMV